MNLGISTLAILLLLSSCSANWHLKKARQKGAIFEQETVIVDTVYKQITRMDTVFRYNFTDTVIIKNKDSVIVKYFHSKHDSLVYIEAECPDCPEITKTIEKTTEVQWQQSFWERVKSGMEIAMIVVVIIGLILISRQIFKKR